MISDSNTEKIRKSVSDQSLRALDCLNIMIGDVLGGLGPYLAARHYNVTRGAIITAQGIGAVLSNLLGGFVVARFGYVSGFLVLALIGLAGLLICCFGLPETRNLEPELGSFKDG